MIINKVDNAARKNLMLTLIKYTNSISKRNVNFVVHAQSKTVASIDLIVTGKKGSVQKSVVLIYDTESQEWKGYSDGYEYIMLSLTDISLIFKNMIQKLSTVLTKV